MSVKPIVQALLVADHVYEDRVSRKKIVVGIFYTLFFVKKLPTPETTKEGEESAPKKTVVGIQAGSPYAYINLTNIRGRQDFVLRYVDLQDYQVLFEIKFFAECDDPLQVAELIAPLPPLPAKKSGVCALELLWNDEPIGSFRIRVQEMIAGEPSDDSE